MSRNNKKSNVSVKSQIAQLKSSLHGHVNELKSIAPPTFTRKPFNTITVEEILDTSNTSDVYISLQSMIKALRKQLVLGEEANQGSPSVLVNSLAIKIKRVDLFCLPKSSDSSELISIRGRFFGLVPVHGLGPGQIGVQVPLKIVQDIGLFGAECAVVSYTWPRDQSDMPLASAVTGSTNGLLNIFQATAANDNDTIIARYHLLWNTGEDVQDTVVPLPLPLLD